MSASPVALLFWDVDTQRDFIEPSGRLYVPEAETLKKNLARLTRAALRYRIPVIASADDHEMSDPEISRAPDFRLTYPPHCMRGTEGARRISETDQEWSLIVGSDALDPASLDRALASPHPRILIHKKSVDVFDNANTEILLGRLTPRRIAVYGVALDVCNRCAVEGLLERGYEDLAVIVDATKPIDPRRARGLLNDWRRSGVELMTTAELLSRIAAGATAGP